MKVTLWGTRGSIPTITAETAHYGGNTPCISIDDGETVVILDAGSGIRKAADTGYLKPFKKIHILLTHLHMDHIQGLGFFGPFFDPEMDVTIWGPKSDIALEVRLNRYLSPPLFPVRIRDFNCKLTFKNVPMKPFEIGPFRFLATYLCHPGPTLGYRISHHGASLAFIPDHEPALSSRVFPAAPEWTSGYQIAQDADVLIHDAQFSPQEYQTRIGWGHSSFAQAIEYARLVGTRHLFLYHHDPSHTDEHIDRLYKLCGCAQQEFPITIAEEGAVIDL